ncbi:MAG: hypothetical protein PHZ19_08180 [Candidatus Thermoplasmatota archaeon]|nr:hypothetical protein [Candidatus Thermoplasmatota archaeon]
MLPGKIRTGKFTAAATPAQVDLNIGFVPWYFKMVGNVAAANDIAEVEWFRDMGDAKAKKQTIIVDNGTAAAKNTEFISSGGISAYEKKALSPQPWAKNTAYKVGDVVHPTVLNGYFYKCTAAGTSHATTEPTWPTTVGGTVTDNTVTWTCIAMGDKENLAAVQQFHTYGVSIPAGLQKASAEYFWIAIGEDTFS